MEYDELSNKVIGLTIEVHRTLGPGLLESTYEKCLARELTLANIPFKVQYSLPMVYKGIEIDCGYRVDLLIDDNLIVELRSVDKLLSIYDAQVLTYMKLSNSKIGLLINFNVERLKDGIKRFVL
ncbi:MAG: GxxExxY protein [Candidatus Omnitrophica bacterium]|nr:GxxExxY protein [Candidatus Omnitrophota bacterium]